MAIYRKRSSDGSVFETSQISKFFPNWQGGNEAWLFIAPHDDDIVLGAGKTLLAALEEGVDVHCAITTDGAMGYCSLEVRDTISEVREKECFNSFRELGVEDENIYFLHFPDCNLVPFQGRFRNVTGHPSEIAGAGGLQNAYTHLLRKVRPTRVFIPTSTDLHPDHRIVNREVQISLFHAEGGIWPELGAATNVPSLYEYATYCDFPEAPQLCIEVPAEILEKKWRALRCYESQTQIESLIESQKQSGSLEYIREVPFNLYSPQQYAPLFKS